jgi:spore coat polysaccharide biosynthesis protein SpsF
MALPLVMSEIVRCSNKYVLSLEYFAENTVEVPYRGQRRALFKRNYGSLYKEMFVDLNLIERGELGRDQGWDNVTYWLFERKHPI